MNKYDYKKGLPAIFGAYLIWGFQSLYYYLCRGLDTFFILAARIIFAGIACFILVAALGKTGELKAAFCDRKILKREAGAMLLLFFDWAIYLWGVQNSKVMECSLGYYIQPIVVFAFGALIFREKLTWKHIVILSIILAGVVLSSRGFGGLPWITVTLALLFAVYAANKKSLTLNSIVSTTMEIILMMPIGILMILIFYRGDNGVAGLTFVDVLLLIGSGIITAVPMLLYSTGISALPLMTAAVVQYLSPTFGIICGAITGETLTKEKMVSFAFVWLGIILYTLNLFSEHKKEIQAGKQGET